MVKHEIRKYGNSKTEDIMFPQEFSNMDFFNRLVLQGPTFYAAFDFPSFVSSGLDKGKLSKSKYHTISIRNLNPSNMNPFQWTIHLDQSYSLEKENENVYLRNNYEYSSPDVLSGEAVSTRRNRAPIMAAHARAFPPLLFAFPYLRAVQNYKIDQMLSRVAPLPFTTDGSVNRKSKQQISTDGVSGINLHIGAFANRLTRMHKADAISIGRDIFFSNEKYKLQTPEGIGLLAQ